MDPSKCISDLVRKQNEFKVDGNIMKVWQEEYNKLPSCRDLTGKEYHSCMSSKYKKVYQSCLAYLTDKFIDKKYGGD